MVRVALLFSFIFLHSSISWSSPIHSVTWEKGVNIKVVSEWSKSLSKVSDISSDTYIIKKSGGEDRLHKNKHRDAIIWIPETTDLRQDFTLIFWFHGHWGYVPKRTFENRTLKQFVPLTKDKNFILVIPEMPWSVHTKTPTKRNSLLWLKPGDFMKFVSQVKKLVIKHHERSLNLAGSAKTKIGKIDYKVVGHSAGGSTIMRLGITGDLCKLAPSMVVWSDSSYGLWLKSAWSGCLKNHPNILVKVFVAKGDTPHRRAMQFKKHLKVIPKNLQFYVMKKPQWSHKLIGDNAVELSNLLD